MSGIKLDSVCKSFGTLNVIDNLSVEFAPGSITCITGPSGCGKTTLLNLIAGIIPPDSGSITGVPPKIAFVFQENRLCEDFGAVSNIRLVTGNSLSRRAIAGHLRELSLDEPRRPVREFSGGMKRRVAIARAICPDPDLLILDEPFKGLDEELKIRTADYIRKYSAGKTLICVTHDTDDIALLGADVFGFPAR